MTKLAIAALAAGTMFGSSAMAQTSGGMQAGTSWQAQAPVELAMKGGHGGGGKHHGGKRGGGGKHHGGKHGGKHHGKHRGSFHGGGFGGWGWGWGGGGWGGGGGNWWVAVHTPPPLYYHPCYGWYGGHAATGAWDGEWRDGTYHGSYTPAPGYEWKDGRWRP
jgi:hypothetical protein